jgi:hypothetical protein
MTEHPITPPPELVEQWSNAAHKLDGPFSYTRSIANQAARWGANIELEACVEWLGDAPVVYNDNGDLHPGSYLRDARRPKPLSLKEQALAALNVIEDKMLGPTTEEKLIRKALEQLDD